MIAIIGGLGAAALWATATLVSSKSSRMIGSRVVIGWVMLVGLIVGLPIAVASPEPAQVTPLALALLLLTGICYVAGLSLTYAAVAIGKVSVVAPIVATAGNVSPELMVLATGAGSLILSHVNDGGFWLVQEYFGLTVPQTFRTWTVCETLISVMALVLTFGLAAVV